MEHLELQNGFEQGFLFRISFKEEVEILNILINIKLVWRITNTRGNMTEVFVSYFIVLYNNFSIYILPTNFHCLVAPQTGC